MTRAGPHSSWPDVSPARLRYPRDMYALLEAVTDSPWHLAPCWLPHQRVSEYSPGSVPAVLWIEDRSIHSRFGQWSVLKGATVYDSGERTRQPVTRYRLRDWVVTLVAKPGLPEELIQIRQRRQNRLLEASV